MSKKKVSVLGVNFIDMTLAEMVITLAEHVEKQEKVFLVTANPEIVLHSKKNPDYQQILNGATYVTADGIGIIKAAKLLGKPLPERLTGFDIFMKLLEQANKKNQSVYLLGAKEVVLTRARAKIGELFPNIKIVGMQNGYFDMNDMEIFENIKAANPDYVFAALGFPRQEEWIAKHLNYFEKGIFMGVGGSFDVLSGEVKRAPEIWQKLNIEWLYRLLQQPSRWRRMLAIPMFMLHVISEKVKG